MLPIELIIFDMDGVLCDTDFARRLDILGQMTSLDAKVVDDAIFQSGFDDQADRGLHTAEEYLRLFAGRLGVSLSREDWLRARGDAMTPDHAMLALVKQLQQKGCQKYILPMSSHHDFQDCSFLNFRASILLPVL